MDSSWTLVARTRLARYVISPTDDRQWPRAVDTARVRGASLVREREAVAQETLIHELRSHKYDVGSNVVDVVTRTLRKKLGAQSELIETVAGYGYKLRAA